MIRARLPAGFAARPPSHAALRAEAIALLGAAR